MRPLSPRSVQYVHVLLHRLYRDAIRWDRLIRNPCDSADPTGWHLGRVCAGGRVRTARNAVRAASFVPAGEEISIEPVESGCVHLLQQRKSDRMLDDIEADVAGVAAVRARPDRRLDRWEPLLLGEHREGLSGGCDVGLARGVVERRRKRGLCCPPRREAAPARLLAGTAAVVDIDQ